MGRPVSTVQLLCAVGLMGVTPVVSCAGELVENGGFETGSFFPWWAPPSIPNQSTFFVQSGSLAHTGNECALLSSTSLQYIGQVLPTTAGENYELSFWLRRSSGAPATFRVRWEGSLAWGQFMTNSDFDQWQHFTVPLHSNITGSFLEFGQNYFPLAFLLDDVSVRPVPAPSGAAVLGVAGLAALARRRR